jgi:hypothetical protein
MAQNYDQGMMTAFGITSSMKTKSFYTDPFHALTNILDEEDDNDTYNCFLSTAILESKYEKANIQDVANQQVHLTKTQQKELHTLFAKSTKLFSGKLGNYPFKKMDLELLPDAHPIHSK